MKRVPIIVTMRSPRSFYFIFGQYVSVELMRKIVESRDIKLNTLNNLIFALPLGFIYYE